MKGANSPLLRAIYIILVPVVLLIILLNSGWLQRYIPAATVHGDEHYTVTRYNFYYFDYYNDFLDQNADRLEELGYDPQQSAKKQAYDGAMTWKEFFQRKAETNMAETAYYCDLADAAGYQFSDEELAPVREKLAKNEAQRTKYGINANNYYLSYYGAGMNEQRYTEELTRKVKAQAYKTHLIETYVPDEFSVSAWLAEHPENEYQAVALKVITLDALPDRADGQIGEAQLNALQAKLARLEERYQSGISFDDLQAEFSTKALGGERGLVTATTSAALPDVLVQQFLTDQNGLAEGQTYALVDASTGTAYFAQIIGFSGSGPRLDAAAALSQQAIEAQQETALADYTVNRNALGMLIATT